MKKKICVLFLFFVGLLSVAQARFYIGVEGGYASQGLPLAQEKGKGIEAHIISPNNLGDLIEYGAKGYSIGVVFGTESFFGRYFGVRWGLGLGYSSTEKELYNNGKEKEYDFDAFNSNLSFDLMVNFVNTGNFSFGMFGGVGIDYQYFTNIGNPDWHALGFEGRVGLSTLLGGHHRMEVFAKLPFADLSAKISQEDKHWLIYNANKAVFGASYKFVF